MRLLLIVNESVPVSLNLRAIFNSHVWCSNLFEGGTFFLHLTFLLANSKASYLCFRLVLLHSCLNSFFSIDHLSLPFALFLMFCHQIFSQSNPLLMYCFGVFNVFHKDCFICFGEMDRSSELFDCDTHRSTVFGQFLAFVV